MGRFGNKVQISESDQKQEEIQNAPEEAAPMKAGAIPIWKYFELYMPDVDKYHKAYLGGHFRGQMKMPEEWAEEIKQHIKE